MNARRCRTITGAASDQSRACEIPPHATNIRRQKVTLRMAPRGTFIVVCVRMCVCARVCVWMGKHNSSPRSSSGSSADKRTATSEPSPPPFSSRAFCQTLNPSSFVTWFTRWVCAYDSCKGRPIEKAGSTARTHAGLRPRKSSTHIPAIWQRRNAG